MRLIKQLCEMIEDELEGAELYAKKALKCKDDRSPLAKMFYSLATEEMDHISRLHTAVVDEIEEYKEKKGEPPVEMMALYNYMHEKHIDHATKIKTMLEMYKESR